jgi:hypothetical protein
LADTDSVTVPLALPLCPDVIAIQLLPDAARQSHPASTKTLTLSRPPAGPIASLERLSENRHGAAAWLN